MIERIKHYISVGACFARLAIQRQLEYPLFLVSWLLGIPTYWLTSILMLKVLIVRFNSIGGWTFPQLTFIYGLGLLSHGIMVIVFIQYWGIGRMVIHGSFDLMLLRPMSIFFQLSVNYINFIGLFDLIPGAIIFAYGCYSINFHWSILNIIKLLFVILGGVLIRASFYMTIGCISFWTKANNSLVGLGQMLFQYGTIYPLSIYPYLFQALLTFVIPVGFISFYPSCEFLSQNHAFALPLGMAVWTPIVGLLMFGAARLMFVFGLKHYESSGS